MERKVFRRANPVFTFTLSAFQELLADETCVNISKLREAARHGVPNSVRGEVWKLLLGVTRPDKAEDGVVRRQLHEEYSQILSKANLDSDVVDQVRLEIQRYVSHHDYFKDKDRQARLEQVLAAWVSTHRRLSPRVLHLLGPIVYCIKEDAEAYACLVQLLMLVDQHALCSKLPTTLSNFLTLFRSLQSELCTYYDDQEVIPNQWAIAWLQGLLGGNLPLECVARLWDTYLSTDDGFDLHVYVCLSVLFANTEDLMELEHSDILSYLASLPPIDMDLVIMHAQNMREEVAGAKLL